jgi:hypothetical protein
MCVYLGGRSNAASTLGGSKVLIHRTENLVTPTPGVLAINHETKRRLASRLRAVANSETLVLVVEFYGQCPHIEESFFDWWAEADAPVQCHEERVPEATNRMGRAGAFCTVVDLHELLEFARGEGMVWVARDREMLSSFGARA